MVQLKVNDGSIHIEEFRCSLYRSYLCNNLCNTKNIPTNYIIFDVPTLEILFLHKFKSVMLGPPEIILWNIWKISAIELEFFI